MKYKIFATVFVLVILVILYGLFSGGEDGGTETETPTIQMQF